MDDKLCHFVYFCDWFSGTFSLDLIDVEINVFCGCHGFRVFMWGAENRNINHNNDVGFFWESYQTQIDIGLNCHINSFFFSSLSFEFLLSFLLPINIIVEENPGYISKISISLSKKLQVNNNGYVI
eukprot:528377_1